MWFTKKHEPKPSFLVGGYSLNMMLKDGPALMELSAAEYRGMGRQFVGERIFHAPDVEFVGRRWKLDLGTVNDKLYKIAAYLELTNKIQANEAAAGALTFCNDQLGKPAEQRSGLFVWDTTDGNIVLQTAEAADGFAVNLFLTASSVREFQRL